MSLLQRDAIIFVSAWPATHKLGKGSRLGALATSRVLFIDNGIWGTYAHVSFGNPSVSFVTALPLRMTVQSYPSLYDQMCILVTHHLTLQLFSHSEPPSLSKSPVRSQKSQICIKRHNLFPLCAPVLSMLNIKSSCKQEGGHFSGVNRKVGTCSIFFCYSHQSHSLFSKDSQSVWALSRGLMGSPSSTLLFSHLCAAAFLHHLNLYLKCGGRTGHSCAHAPPSLFRSALFCSLSPPLSSHFRPAVFLAFPPFPFTICRSRSSPPSGGQRQKAQAGVRLYNTILNLNPFLRPSMEL